VHLLERLVKDGKKVLLAAPSNTAVDNVLERCAHVDALEARLVRLGESACMAQSVRRSVGWLARGFMKHARHSV